MVLLCTHSNQAVIVEEDTQWITGSNKNVESQVKFVALHEERLVQVFLHNEVVLDRELFAVSNKRYPARKWIRFYQSTSLKCGAYFIVG